MMTAFDVDYFCFLLILASDSPALSVPKRNMVAGSGTGATLLWLSRAFKKRVFSFSPELLELKISALSF